MIRITALPYKLNGVGFIGEKFAQLVIIEPEGTAPPRVLTSGRMDHSNPAWSPDGRYIAVSMSQSQVAETPDPKRMFVGDIGLVPAGGGTIRKLTDSVGPAYAPAFSPDGRTIAYIGHARQYGDYTQPSIWSVDVQRGGPRDVTAAYDRPFGDQSIGDLLGHGEVAPTLVWAPDGRAVYHVASDSGETHLVRVDMVSGRVEPVTRGRRVIYNFSFSMDARRAALCHGDPVTPNDVFLLELGSSARERRLTEVNREFQSTVQLAEPERYTFRSGEVTVEGWIMRLPGLSPSAKTPAVLQVHGGPMIMYGYPFFFEFQLLAANGTTVVYTNPRGSMGYGQSFVAAIRGHWGDKDFQDIMNGIEAAVKRGGIDRDRLGIAGGSYGGFMVNWAVGHSDRFRTAISMRSISNEYSFFGTSDFGFANLVDFDGPPWLIPDVYLKYSPISYVEKVKTPVLLIQSENDLRTPMSESEQFYTALKVLGREVVFLRFQGEDHDLSRTGRPWSRIYRLEQIVRWFDKCLG